MSFELAEHTWPFLLLPVQLPKLEFSSQSLNPKMLESSVVFGVGHPSSSSCMGNPLNPSISMSCSIPDSVTLPHSPLEAKILRGASVPSLCSQISAVRLPREPTNPERLKGFGYAEFEDIDSLFQALSLNEEVSQIPASKSTSQGLKGLQGPREGFGHGLGVVGKGQMSSSWKREGSGGI